MTGEELRQAIRSLLGSHPSISPSDAGHVAHVERYITRDGVPIGFEPERIRLQNLWVRADSVRLHRLKDIQHTYFDSTTFEDSKPNHNLYGEPQFKDCDLIRFSVESLWQAVRVLEEVAGEAHSA